LSASLLLGRWAEENHSRVRKARSAYVPAAAAGSKTIPYQNLPEADYRDLLRQFGLPAPLAAGIASWGVEAGRGALFDNGHQLSRLIGRPTETSAAAVSQALTGRHRSVAWKKGAGGTPRRTLAYGA